MSRASDMRAMRVVLERLEGVADRHSRPAPVLQGERPHGEARGRARGDRRAHRDGDGAARAWVDLASSGWLSWVPGRAGCCTPTVMTGFAEQVFRAESKSA
jgi:hypothetical protein